MVKVVTYILGNNATVQGLLGNKAQTQTDIYYKVYPVVAPQTETAPYIAVRMTGKVPFGKNNCGNTYTINVVSYAKSYDEVTTLNDAVITAITSTSGATINGQAFSYLNLTNESDDFVLEHRLYAKVTTFEGVAE